MSKRNNLMGLEAPSNKFQQPDPEDVALVRYLVGRDIS